MQHLQPLITIISSVSFGILCIILADRLKLPSILFLLLTGLCLGPYGANLIQPSVFREELPQYITLLVALILFEGGTYLRFEQLKDISRPLRNLLTSGMIITLVCATLGAHWILKMPWVKSILFGSILIITGPTVVQPILQRIKVKEKIHNLLKWESILIDPLGVIIAVVLSEILLLDNIGPLEGLGLLGARIVIGLVLGFAAGQIMYFCLSRPSLLRFESEELSGIFILAVTLLSYGASEAILSESGIVTVTMAGIVFGNKKLAHLETILRFKKQLTLIALSVIFILLSANIPLPKIQDILGEGTLFLCFLIFIVRPLSVFLSNIQEKSLTVKEKLFISFFAPRGIVSAVLASLFTLLFEQKEILGRGVFLPLAFYVIAGSIVFYSVASWFIARILDVREEIGRRIVIVGANAIGIIYAQALRDCGFHSIFIDTNPDLCQKAESLGFETYQGSATDKNFLEELDLKGVHQMIAVTPNHEANILSCQLMSVYLGKKSVFRLWDKSDTWKKAASHTYNETWGRPVVLTIQTGTFPDSTYSTIKQKVPEPLLINEKYCTTSKFVAPLFALCRETIMFPTPNSPIPPNSELFVLKPVVHH